MNSFQTFDVVGIVQKVEGNVIVIKLNGVGDICRPLMQGILSTKIFFWGAGGEGFHCCIQVCLAIIQVTKL